MSTRRQARAAATATSDPVVAGDVLALLRDPDAAVWRDHGAFLELMAAHGWTVGVIAACTGTHPANRRNVAADAWGVENGITGDSPHQGDWHRLRAMGLIAP